MVHDRDNVGQAPTRTGVGGEHVVVARASSLDGVDLVAVQTQACPPALLALAETKDAAAFLVKHASRDKVINPATGLERGVQLEERIGPEEARFEFIGDFGRDPRVLDADIALDVLAIVFNQAMAKLEDIQSGDPPRLLDVNRTNDGNRTRRADVALEKVQTSRTPSYNFGLTERNGFSNAPDRRRAEKPGARAPEPPCPARRRPNRLAARPYGSSLAACSARRQLAALRYTAVIATVEWQLILEGLG